MQKLKIGYFEHWFRPPYTFAEFSNVDYLISNEPMPENFALAAEKAGVIIL